MGEGGQGIALGIPHAGQALGAVVGIARLGAVGIDEARYASCQVVSILDGLVAGQAVKGHLLHADVAQMAVGVAVDNFRRRIGVGIKIERE